MPPLMLRYGATDVPIIQPSLSSTTLSDSRLNDLGQNVIRPDLAIVHGAEVPQPAMNLHNRRAVLRAAWVPAEFTA